MDELAVLALLASVTSVGWFLLSRAYPVFGLSLLERVGKLNTYGGGLTAAWLIYEARSLIDHPAVVVAGGYLIVMGLVLRGHTFVIERNPGLSDADHR